MAEPQHGPLRRFVVRAATLAAAACALAPLALVAVAARLPTALRRRRGLSPRLIWGPVPLISLKYWSEAVKLQGYPSTVWVHEISPINSTADFDRVFDRFLGSRRLALLAGDYPLFARALFRADIFLCFLEGSFLHRTPLQRLEGPLLRLAGKRLVVSPYGGDIAVPGYLGAAEDRLLEDYPQFVETADEVRDRVDYYCRWADVVVRNYQYGYLPRADVLWPTQLAIDTEQWPERPPAVGDGRNGLVRVVHAPNHRRIKGTDVLLRVVDELRGEGLEIELELLERRPNEEVRRALLDADVVADQFVAGYAMFAIEGLSAGKPVISTLSSMPADARAALPESPIVDADLTSLKEALRGLVTDPPRRRALGRAGREFALRYHSLDGVGRSWIKVFDHLWRDAQLPQRLPQTAGQSAAAVAIAEGSPRES